MDEFDEYGEVAGLGFEGPTADQMALVVRLAQRQVRLEADIASLERNLNEAKAEHRLVSESDLPSALVDAGMRNFTLTDGSRISLNETVVGYVKKEDEDEFFAWLEETGQSAIIKRTISAQFGKGEGAVADSVLSTLVNNFPTREVGDRRSVHHQTLQAWVRENYAKGNEMPAVVNVTELRKAVVGRQRG